MTDPDPPDREEPEFEVLSLEALEEEAFRSVDGAYGDEPADPRMQAVIEAGGGVAEGFEQAEALLVDHATLGGLDATDRILRDAGAPEQFNEHGVYGEADEERTSERREP
jgi:hypothetical protein